MEETKSGGTATKPCAGCSKPANAKSCPTCRRLGLPTAYFCSQECFRLNWKKHNKAVHSRKECTVDTLDMFYTPNCHIRIETERLVLRTFELSDLGNCRKIKKNRQVQQYQFYGDPEIDTILSNFLWGYIRTNMPWVPGDWYGEAWGGGGTGVRARYAFAITVKPTSNIKSSNPAEFSPGKDGYVGQIVLRDVGRASFGKWDRIDMETRGGEHQFPECIPRDGEVLEWPKYDLLRKGNGLQTTLFYELHPCFWHQGVMSEAIRAACDYAYTTYRIRRFHADPLYANTSSLKMLKGLSFIDRHKPSKERSANMWLIKDVPQDGSPGDPRSGKKVCRWCVNAIEDEGLKCERCDWSWYCSAECRAAHSALAGRGGHREACPL